MIPRDIDIDRMG